VLGANVLAYTVTDAGVDAEAAVAVPASAATTAAAITAIFMVRNLCMDAPFRAEHPSRTPLPMLLMVVRTGSGVACCDQAERVGLGVTKDRPTTKTLR